LKLCQKIVLKLAKNFGVLPDGFEIDVEPPEANRFPTGNGGFAVSLDPFLTEQLLTSSRTYMLYVDVIPWNRYA